MKNDKQNKIFNKMQLNVFTMLTIITAVIMIVLASSIPSYKIAGYSGKTPSFIPLPENELISIDFDGNEGGNDVSGALYGLSEICLANFGDHPVVISEDGTYVAFFSEATDLDSKVTDSDNSQDVFLRNRQTGETICVSQLVDEGVDKTFGILFPFNIMWGSIDIAEDDQYVYVAFAADGLIARDYFSVYPHEHTMEIYVSVCTKGPSLELNSITIPTSILDTPDYFCYNRPSLSSNGMRLAFQEYQNPVKMEDKSDRWPYKPCGPFLVYVIREADYITNDFSYPEIVSVYATSDHSDCEETSWFAGDPNPFCSSPRISGDGRYVAFLGYPGPALPGEGGLIWMGDDGRIFSQSSDPNNIWNNYYFHDGYTWWGYMAVIIRDIEDMSNLDADHYQVVSLCNNTNFRLLEMGDPLPDGHCGGTDQGYCFIGGARINFDISYDGRYIAFITDATNMTPEDIDTNDRYDIYIRDRFTNQTKCVSWDLNGDPTSFDSMFPSISGDGRYLTYLRDGTNNHNTIFLYDHEDSKTIKVSMGTDFQPANDDSDYCVISNDSKVVAFSSKATNLVSQDVTNAEWDVFVRFHLWRALGELQPAPPRS